MTFPELQSAITIHAKELARTTGEFDGRQIHVTFSHRSGYDYVFSKEKPRYAVASISAFFLEQANFLGGFSICIPEQK